MESSFIETIEYVVYENLYCSQNFLFDFNAILPCFFLTVYSVS